ncbi:hypothetical protein DVA67_009245 [Solirubrobacter sp. CPCC 204708]|uniref:Uncharacterized protein n=1 Tax=Solirubrobacter deserti TaxID=2282478 RepID=A0ABT4REF2_9ACTN|nr:hypothetical protein [Solirubrobacter deserti]MBE2316159.1 hypothetical protein [Solirubrobacter deserti]MDA0136908.1 hypothetical protein [Solirubrobacter deserti]
MSRWWLEDAREDELRFRPESLPAPPARGRRTLELHEDGSFTALAPGPDDRPKQTDELDEFYVAELADDQLTLKRGPRLP